MQKTDFHRVGIASLPDLNGAPLWIGESTDELTSGMPGDIDDVRIFDKALTEAEIATIASL